MHRACHHALFTSYQISLFDANVPRGTELRLHVQRAGLGISSATQYQIRPPTLSVRQSETGQGTRLTETASDGSHDDGEVSCGILDGLAAGSKVVVVVRPESINLHLQQPTNVSNVIAGKIGAAMFLGEYVDCTIELGKNVLQTHQRYTLQVRRGDPVWVELPAAECMALPTDR